MPISASTTLRDEMSIPSGDNIDHATLSNPADGDEELSVEEVFANVPPSNLFFRAEPRRNRKNRSMSRSRNHPIIKKPAKQPRNRRNPWGWCLLRMASANLFPETSNAEVEASGQEESLSRRLRFLRNKVFCNVAPRGCWTRTFDANVSKGTLNWQIRK